jgi:demethylmenaquinone methyltransferase/2-methoxy-6-polyprenyl-1,4-benzoquinol methylase
VTDDPIADRQTRGLLEAQLRYYRARVDEYDEMMTTGDRFGAEGDEVVRAILRRLDELGRLGRVLELAAGTGWWTKQLLARADSVTAVDGAPEMIERNRLRVGDPRVRYVVADLFDWQPDERYDLVFFAFWLSHVPVERFEAFWTMVQRALVPGGRFFCVDTHWDAGAAAAAGPVVARELDGRGYRIVKVLHQPDELRARLERLGWEVEARAVDDEFFYATGARSTRPEA